MNRRRERGAVLVLTAGALVALLAFASIAIDLGYQRVARRDMQAVADIVALDLVRLVDGRTAAEIVNGAGGKTALLTAESQSLARNDDAVGEDAELYVELGTYDEDTGAFTTMYDERTGAYTPANGSGLPTHVRVSATADTRRFFDLGRGEGKVERRAIAARTSVEQARFRIGSSLVSVNPQTSSIIGQLVNAVVPGASLLGYEGLTNATVSLDALGLALGIPLTAMSPDELLNTNVGFNQLSVAMVTALQNSGGGTAAIKAMNDLIALGVPATQVNLGELLGVTAGEGGPALDTTLAVGTLLTSAIFAIDGDHAISLPGTELNVPNLASLGLRLTGIEAPREGGNGEGASATTRQIHLEITPVLDIDTSRTQDVCKTSGTERNIIAGLLTGVVNLLLCVLGAVLNQVVTIQINAALPLSVDIAQVTASQHIDCAAKKLTVTPTPAAVTVAGGVDLDLTAKLAGQPLGNLLRLSIPVGASAHGASTAASFTAVDPGTPTAFGTRWTTFAPASARVGSSPLGLSGFLQLGQVDNDPDPDITLRILNLDLPVLGNLVLNAVQPALNLAFSKLDELVLTPLAQLLGLNLGASDITPLWLRCDRSSVSLVG